jgi:hypothetical protein
MVMLGARLAALERARQIGTAWNVIAEAWGEGEGDGEATYTVCGRWPGEAPQQLTPEEYARFTVDHPVRLLRVYYLGARRASHDEPQ